MPEVVIVPAFFFLIGFIVSITITGWQRRQRLKLVTEFNTRLLDRLGTVKEFHEFIQSDAGVQFMNSMGTEPVTGGPHERILRATQIGIVMLTVGLGLFLSGRFIGYEDPEARRAFMAIGSIVLSLGIGFVISAAASYRLASMLGVLPPGMPSGPHTAR